MYEWKIFTASSVLRFLVLSFLVKRTLSDSGLHYVIQTKTFDLYSDRISSSRVSLPSAAFCQALLCTTFTQTIANSSWPTLSGTRQDLNNRHRTSTENNYQQLKENTCTRASTINNSCCAVLKTVVTQIQTLYEVANRVQKYVYMTCSYSRRWTNSLDTTVPAVSNVFENIESRGRLLASNLCVGCARTEICQNAVVKATNVHVQSTQQVEFEALDEDNHLRSLVVLSGQSLQLIAVKTGHQSVPVVFFLLKSSDAFFARDLHSVSRESLPVSRDVTLLSCIIIVSVSVPRPNLSHPVNLIFAHHRNIKSSERAQCVFWNTSTHTWSRQGCWHLSFNASHSHCQCNHLSSFAVLMSPRYFEDNGNTQTILTEIGITLSMVSLMLGLATFIYFPRLRDARGLAHVNLMGCLQAGYVIFIIGIDRVEHDVGCALVAVLLHYAFMCAFFWMLVEGTLVFMLLALPIINRNIASHATLSATVYVVAYGAPLLIVFVSASVGIEGYGTDKYCWLSPERGLIWSFLGPAVAILFLNTLVLVIAIFAMLKHAAYSRAIKNRTCLLKMRIWLTGVSMLVVVIGIFWIIGIFSYVNNAFAYLFIVANAFQGFYIFVLYCVLNAKAIAEYQRLLGKTRWVPGWIVSLHGINKFGAPSATHTDFDLLGVMAAQVEEHSSQPKIETQKKVRKYSWLMGIMFGFGADDLDTDTSPHRPLSLFRRLLTRLVDTVNYATKVDIPEPEDSDIDMQNVLSVPTIFHIRGGEPVNSTNTTRATDESSETQIPQIKKPLSNELGADLHRKASPQSLTPESNGSDKSYQPIGCWEMVERDVNCDSINLLESKANKGESLGMTECQKEQESPFKNKPVTCQTLTGQSATPGVPSGSLCVGELTENVDTENSQTLTEYLLSHVVGSTSSEPDHPVEMPAVSSETNITHQSNTFHAVEHSSKSKFKAFVKRRITGSKDKHPAAILDPTMTDQHTTHGKVSIEENDDSASLGNIASAESREIMRSLGHNSITSLVSQLSRENEPIQE
ncbi:adhesion G protein-coupled receptor L4-like [Littorina saxatilis]|uniref:adhesion G protein-coupled receptor L4-like n=1 Tax=Littorina saxatilis TaxID=31220 RepID=UPI0038B67659